MKAVSRGLLLVCALAVGVWIWRSDDAARPFVAEPATLSVSEAPALDGVDESQVGITSAGDDASRVELAQASGHSATSATLSVVCVHDDGSPAQGVAVGVRGAAGVNLETASGEANSHSVLQGVSDEAGRAELIVESGFELTVFARSNTTGGVSEKVPALSRGERRDVTLWLRRGKGLLFHGRVVDAQTGEAPIGAFVQASGRAGHTITVFGGRPPRRARPIALVDGGEVMPTALDGRFTVSFEDFELGDGLAAAPGYSPILFPLGAGREDVEREFVVRIARSGSLAVTVFGFGRTAVEGAEIVVHTEPSNVFQAERVELGVRARAPAWVARTSATGFAELHELAAGVPLNLTVYSEHREPLVWARPIVLEPGERRELVLSLEDGEITGRAIDDQGRPVVGLTIGCAPAREGDVATLLRDVDDELRTTTTDTQGEFVFEDVQDGTWFVGTVEVYRNLSDARALARSVRVVGGFAEKVELRVEKDLRIDGTVLDPSGAPMSDTIVAAEMLGTSATMLSRTNVLGQFAFAPAPRGKWNLMTLFGHGKHAPSEELVVDAGTSGVVLQLRAGGSISGRVVDPSVSKPSVSIALLTREVTGTKTDDLRGDEFAFDGLLPRDYAICASTSGGLCGFVGPLIVDAGTALADVEVTLQRGARVILRNGGDVDLWFRVQVKDFVVKSERLMFGSHAEIVVPPGAVAVDWMRRFDDEPFASERFELVADGVRELRRPALR